MCENTVFSQLWKFKEIFLLALALICANVFELQGGKLDFATFFCFSYKKVPFRQKIVLQNIHSVFQKLFLYSKK